MPTVDPNYNNAAISSWLNNKNDLTMNGTKTYTIASGIYSVHDMKLASNANLVIGGDVTLYVSGDLSLAGGINVSGLRPGNFKIRMVTAGTNAKITGSAELYADLYAPGSDVSIAGSGDFYGTAVGLTLNLGGRAGIHWDETLPCYGGGSRVWIVQ
jgi:hypothetical protein